jgi:hypothetical protein
MIHRIDCLHRSDCTMHVIEAHKLTKDTRSRFNIRCFISGNNCTYIPAREKFTNDDWTDKKVLLRDWAGGRRAVPSASRSLPAYAIIGV